ncbi:uncharacterized protein ColSpa_09938 [Colletotrichum spaethianum]|uniref:Uncharacterized protein n=1 Tax=Colletotrichum spaethianum TaxID=700344 RepID=A0AA37UQZ5_9PEZI|nr:uncharacterized protein ColSpa_09938 [Colletotrichum spaethianum]GKT49757.1 hypothetical protein ColSpa_09938 [Colletotrichum spaethianum]
MSGEAAETHQLLRPRRPPQYPAVMGTNTLGVGAMAFAWLPGNWETAGPAEFPEHVALQLVRAKRHWQ